jgi:MerR family transcriptional regulator, light-induced transcriptional regulator
MDRTARETVCAACPAVSIAEAERETGVSKETLRIWERRYGFPTPERDAQGDRRYPREQIERLALIKRVLDLGHRAGRTVGLPVEELQQLAAGGAPIGAGRGKVPHAASQIAPPIAPQPMSDATRRGWLQWLHRHDAQGLRQALARELGALGLSRFVLEVVAPLLAEVGEAWHRGEIDVYQEHLCTQLLATLLRQAIEAAANRFAHGPKVLLTTLPAEAHGMGLLMVEALLTLAGARCQPLGLQTPPAQIAKAAVALGSDIVCLSCSPCVDSRRVFAGLTELRVALPPTVALWAGGTAPVLRRRPVAGVHVFDSLHAVRQALRPWLLASARRAAA